ncbi:hypothetical protein [Aquimarina litoralis]|uniref:hypothetical protein n=1 Tax=Aquimarina litoralis TaxID=584605 RepID=UPI001C597B62|nr:hypothetical protein [Aquimarina litoralis]MBW1295897.1 hypothetical protein [Aquimarina litoralis]
MKKHILLFFFLFTGVLYPNDLLITLETSSFVSIQTDRKLSDEEVQQRGLDLLANEVIEKIDEIDLRKMARSAIFETSYGFRWKMINLHTGSIIIVKVNKDFKLISARNSKKTKIMNP